MDNDQKLQYDVEQALKREPLLVGAEIAVISRDGVVTLMGTVDSYAKKRVAEHASKTVKGVEAVIEKIEVVFTVNGKKSDTTLIKEILDALKQNPKVPKDQILVQVENGWVSLEGTVKWQAEKIAALTCIENIAGIRAVDNLIFVKSETEDVVEKLGIEEALIRNSTVHKEDIKVAVFGNTVTLSGIVHSIYQKDEAERIAWNAPGVWNVHNDLFVDYKISS
ncbi:BON domain-containing protein [Pedobacter sp. SL55]|uniref:BON domain-containing protein n=1 Tax=Pedobacter sp. SL55 TaxID=2995161 RepID=UPI00226EBE7D|nr:BON domain-containing protein [Pedobacter sp. SL55]WAC39399.1 BON domain-containing protein [Pedobacter sp. SL55]